MCRSAADQRTFSLSVTDVSSDTQKCSSAHSSAASSTEDLSRAQSHGIDLGRDVPKMSLFAPRAPSGWEFRERARSEGSTLKASTMSLFGYVGAFMTKRNSFIKSSDLNIIAPTSS